jgi:putative tryptophan/tyrosine transport system substrate-binding protein
MKRRQFITLLGGAAAAWPLAARAQQPAMPVVGFLNSVSPGQFGHFLDMFRRGLNETGFVEGRNVRIEYRWAEGHFDRLPALAADLVGRNAAVIAATGGPASGLAAKVVTATTPIVFVSAGDPVKEGFVASFNRPGGNATGINLLLSAMEGKRLGLLRELVPSAALIGVLLNPAMPTFDGQLNEIQEAARALGQQIHVLHVSNEREIDAAFASAAELRVGALLVTADPFMFSRLDQLVALAKRNSIPVFYFAREFAAAGGLISYGISLAEAYRLVGVYTGRILNGEKPADLPVQQLSKFEMVINLNTAKALGVKISDDLLSLADEVIE